jgi:uncharacterized protein YjeT (DUF2065 family)
MRELFTSIGLVLVIEGLLYAVAPGRLKSLAEFASRVSDDMLRNAGIVAVAAGVAIVWAARTFMGAG